MTDSLRIATRGSHLALAQAHYIQKRISELPNAPQTELIVVKTTGDANQIISLADASGNNERKGLFTKEIEDALLENRADIAVHSFKDLPTEMVPELTLAAIPQRLEPRELLIFPKSKRLFPRFPHLKAGSVIGTSSARRLAQISFRFPEMKSVLLRGNVPTRIASLLKEGGPDATFLSGAGVNRLRDLGIFNGTDAVDLADFEVIPVPLDCLVPAPAQGALAIQCRSNDSATIQLLKGIHDSAIADLVSMERTVLAGLEGGCHLPLGTHALKIEESHAPYYQMLLFLGGESPDNRRQKSYQVSRSAVDPERLSRFVLTEVQRQIPIVLTGQKERNDELAGPGIISLPLIQTRLLDVDWNKFKGLNAPGSVAAFFSPTGVRAASSVQDLLNTNTILAAVGNKTAQIVRRMFGRDAITGPGNGEDLAHMILQETSGPVFAFQALNGRNEFVDTIRTAGREIHSIHMYETLNVAHEPEAFESIPEESFVVFPSPSAFHAFLSLLERYLAKKPSTIDFADKDPVHFLNKSNLRLVSIGGTTTRAMLDKKCIPYIESEIPDLDMILQELRN
ncbi:MAG: hydroxymethylbilane synthase [Spirochaetia bacterium]|nr:hydroxymethylbilane synthase [Spirochaetia bacterium]